MEDEETATDKSDHNGVIVNAQVTRVTASPTSKQQQTVVDKPRHRSRLPMRLGAAALVVVIAVVVIVIVVTNSSSSDKDANGFLLVPTAAPTSPPPTPLPTLDSRGACLGRPISQGLSSTSRLTHQQLERTNLDNLLEVQLCKCYIYVSIYYTACIKESWLIVGILCPPPTVAEIAAKETLAEAATDEESEEEKPPTGHGW